VAGATDGDGVWTERPDIELSEAQKKRKEERWVRLKEVCVGDSQTNTMLRREYRGSWHYPEAKLRW